MGPDERINCTLCQHLAGDTCTLHDVELDNPAFTVCAHFCLPHESAETMSLRFPQLQELNPETIYEIDPTGEASPLLQLARRRRQRTKGTGRLNAALFGLPDVAPSAGIDLTERFCGALVGLGLGDALGFPAEGRSPAEIEMIYGGPLTGLIGRIGRRHTWPVGQIAKDTQLALALGESLVEAKQLDMDDFAERLVKLYPSALRLGKSTGAALAALAEGRHWSASGIDSNGSGSVVRVVPLALLHHADYARLRQEAVLQSMPTHQATKAYAGAVLFGTAVAALVNTPTGAFDRGEWLSLLERAVRGIDAEMTVKLQALAVLLADGVEPAAALERLKCGGYVLECLPSALYCFLADPDDPERALLNAANGGFDASAVAAMTGALLGAYHGLSGLPEGMRALLGVQGELEALGLRLAERVRERGGAVGTP